MSAAKAHKSDAEGLLHRIHHLNSVVDNLLLLSRADAGRVELSKAEFELGEVLEGVLDDALTLAEPLDLTVEANIPKHLPVKGRSYIRRDDRAESGRKRS